MALTRRTKPKTKAEPIPPREVEPETYLCEEPKNQAVREIERCSEPCVFQVYRDGLCFNHYKESQGYVFDKSKKIFVKKKEK